MTLIIFIELALIYHKIADTSTLQLVLTIIFGTLMWIARTGYYGNLWDITIEKDDDE